MTRGQAERLFPLLEEMLAAAELTWKDIDAIGVGIGPGNFTGIRIAVASARGLSLSLGIPSIGISTFEVARDGAEHVRLPAPRGAAYVQKFSGNVPDGTPWIDSEPDDQPPATGPDWEGTGIQHLASIAMERFQAGETGKRPAPLYIRAPDAAPSRIVSPVILP